MRLAIAAVVGAIAALAIWLTVQTQNNRLVWDHWDVVKPGIRERFAELRSLGIRTVMVTGDNPLTAAAIAAEAGVDDLIAEATPEKKLQRIRAEQAEGKLVAMCGDGANDAPALAAGDFGYLPGGRVLERTQKLLGTLNRMERHRGHFFNWYDTRSLKPLLPQYVSTVDSGNLAGSLLVLRAGLLEMVGARVLPVRTFDGLRDTIRVLLDVARGHHRMGDELAGLVTEPASSLGPEGEGLDVRRLVHDPDHFQRMEAIVPRGHFIQRSV